MHGLLFSSDFLEEGIRETPGWMASEPEFVRLREAIGRIFADLSTEPLRHGLAGYWSRRINDEHRMVYKPLPDALLIAQLRYHY